MDELGLPYTKIDNFNRNLIENIQGGVIICQISPLTGDSKTLYMSEGWTKLTGYSMQELEEQFGGRPNAIILPEDAPQAQQEYIRQIQNGESYQLEYRIRHKDGHIIWVIDRGVVTAVANGMNQNQSILSDVTPLKESEEKLRLSEKRFRIASKASHAAVFDFDLATNSYLHIENAEVVFRASAEEMIAAVERVKATKPDYTLEDLFLAWFHPDDIPLVMHAKRILNGYVFSECDLRVRQPDNQYIWCKMHRALVDDGYGTPLRVIGYLVNVDEQHKQTERLRQEAQSDALTGLYNKSAVREVIQQELKNHQQLPHALLMLDIDNFKGVNDSLGHLFGDAVLMDVSSKLKKLFRRDGGVVGRIGGDEFVAFLSGAGSTEQVLARAEEICRVFRHTYSGEKCDYKISCSVGVTYFEKGDNYETLFRKADIALYQAKAQGKDQYQVYIETMGNAIADYDRKVEESMADSGKLKIKERIFELLYDSVDFSGSVNMILALLGQLLDVSRVYVYENTPDLQLSSCIFEWCAEGVPPNIHSLPPVPVGKMQYFSLFDEAGIFRCQDTSTLASPVREFVEQTGTHAMFQVAIMEEGVVRGLVGYDRINGRINQSSEQLDIMIFAAKVTGTFIIKKRADESSKLYNQNKMQALDCLSVAIYVIDEHYRLQYVNNLTMKYFPDVMLGEKCYEVFMHNNAPCAECPGSCCQDGPSSALIYNPYSDLTMITSASAIRWNGRDHMRMICCQLNYFDKNAPKPGKLD